MSGILPGFRVRAPGVDEPFCTVELDDGSVYVAGYRGGPDDVSVMLAASAEQLRAVIAELSRMADAMAKDEGAA